MLTRGRCRKAPLEFTVEFDIQEFDVVAVEVANVDGVESNNNCCTCRISTYSSRPDGLAVLFNRESLVIGKRKKVLFRFKCWKNVIMETLINSYTAYLLDSHCYCNNYQ